MSTIINDMNKLWKEMPLGYRDPDKTLLLMPKKDSDKGLRFNEGKTRYDLMPPFALDQLAKIFTFGAKKYAERNWEKGMKWSKVIASLQRHLAAIMAGEDYDSESGLLHAAHVTWNALVLTEYYKIHPQGDDRPHDYLNYPKIGLDIDEVIADFTKGWAKVHGVDERPECWNYHRNMGKEFKKMKEQNVLDDFYLNLEPKIDPNDIPFEPHCYVTSRPVDTEITEQWLEKHKFPGSKVITVPLGTSKIEALKEAGVEVFIDDGFHNFTELNKAGICCFLLDAPHNRRYKVGHKRIYSLKDFLTREIKWK
jgi:hypothetical protein